MFKIVKQLLNTTHWNYFNNYSQKLTVTKLNRLTKKISVEKWYTAINHQR